MTTDRHPRKETAMTAQTETAAGTDYTTVDRGTVQLGTTTYRVEETLYHATGGSQTWLIGPKGATYFLRGFALRPGQHDDGCRQVISWKSGAPLRHKGNEVRVMVVGDIIEKFVPMHRLGRGYAR